MSCLAAWLRAVRTSCQALPVKVEWRQVDDRLLGDPQGAPTNRGRSGCGLRCDGEEAWDQAGGGGSVRERRQEAGAVVDGRGHRVA